MHLGIVIPLVVLPIVLVVAFLWYRRSIASMRPSEAKPVSGLRLTSEALHRLPSPPWRVVHEVDDALGTVDHVVVGATGVIAITTVVVDRPRPTDATDRLDEARRLSAAAIARAPVDDLADRVGERCRLSATVYWGTPDPGRPSFDAAGPTEHLVEGQRIDDWLDGLVAASPVTLDQPQVDAAWRSITMGIGRPDPLI